MLLLATAIPLGKTALKPSPLAAMWTRMVYDSRTYGLPLSKHHWPNWYICHAGTEKVTSHSLETAKSAQLDCVASKAPGSGEKALEEVYLQES